MKSAVDHILDLRGMIVPVTFLNITQVLRDIKSGETVEIVASDPETKRDLFKVLRSFSYEVLNVHNDKTSYRVRLKKGRPSS